MLTERLNVRMSLKTRSGLTAIGTEYGLELTSVVRFACYRLLAESNRNHAAFHADFLESLAGYRHEDQIDEVEEAALEIDRQTRENLAPMSIEQLQAIAADMGVEHVPALGDGIATESNIRGQLENSIIVAGFKAMEANKEAQKKLDEEV